MKLKLFILLSIISSFARAQIIITYAGGGTSGLGDGGLAIAAILNDPVQSTFDKYGNYYFAEDLGNRVRKIDTAGIITTVAGTGNGGYNGDNGLADTSELWQPIAVACDTFGNVYIADEHNDRIRKVDRTTGIISTIAGTGSIGYSGDSGLATNATLNSPTGLCFDKSGNLYISDMSNFVVRKINTSGIITTYAGNGTCCFSGDSGPAIDAKLWLPEGLAADDTGNLYIADWGSKRVRKVNIDGIITTFAGDSGYIYSGDGILATSTNIDPTSIAIDKFGEVFINDNYNNKVRKVDVLGIIHTVAGNGGSGFSGDNGASDLAQIGDPGGIALDPCGNLYISEVDNPRIRKVTFNPYCWPESVPQVVANEVTIYPNPAVEVLHIDNIKTPTKYGIVNILGIIEQRGTLNEGSNSIDVRGLSSGVYVLTLTNIPPDPLQRGNAGEGEGGRVIKKIIKL